MHHGAGTGRVITSIARFLGLFGAWVRCGWIRAMEVPKRIQSNDSNGEMQSCSVEMVTIPRLELCAALVGSRLATFLKRETGLNFSDTVFWTDSTTVLGWILSTHYRYHTYVGNRVGEILETTQPS